MKKITLKNTAFIVSCFSVSLLLGSFAFKNSKKAPVKVDGWAGAGTASNPYQISSQDDLLRFKYIVNGENGMTKNTGACAKLMNDIQVTEMDAFETPIGTNVSGSAYTGTFDGNGFTISGANGQSSSDDSELGYGIFGAVWGGTIKNLTLASGSLYNGSSTMFGALVGVLGNSSTGGTIENCHISSDFKMVSFYETSNGDYNMGGIVGRVQNGSLCYVSKCSNAADLQGLYGKVGGITGFCEGTIENCYNIGKITNRDTDAYSPCVGGITGYAYQTKVINCFNYGEITSNGVNAGGISGTISTSQATYSNNKYLKSGSATVGIYGKTDSDATVKSLTVDEFKKRSSFSDWALGDVWRMGENYPVLGKLVTTITLDNQSATTAGTTTIYQNKSAGFYSNSACTTALTTTAGITVPQKTDYLFKGYYTETNGQGVQILDENGYLASTADCDYFTETTATLYAYWKEPISDVEIVAGTGIKSVYFADAEDAQSGETSGSYADGMTLYGFAVLDKGYKSDASWTLLSGEADTEDALYRIGSITVGTTSFGTIEAEIYTYTISYNLAGGSVSSTNPTIYTIFTETITLNNPTKTGYEFKGWSGTDLTGDANLTVTISQGSIGNRTYTANWIAKEYTVTLNHKNGTDNSEITVTFNQPMPTVPVPTRTGYTFNGYFNQEGGSGTKFINENGESASNWIIDNNRTLYAYWVAIEYTVTLQDYGQVTVKFDAYFSTIVPPTAPDGHLFKGYFDQENGKGKCYIYSDGSGATRWDKASNDITLYPYYQPTQEFVDATEVMRLIDEIPEPSSSDEYFEAVDKAREAYEKLSPEAKAYVDANTGKDYNNVIEENISIRVVVGQIEDIDVVTYNGGVNDSLDLIVLAETSYDDLTPEQQAQVDLINYDSLVHVRTVYNHVDSTATTIKAIPTPAATSEYYDAETSYVALTEEETSVINAATDYDYEKVLNDNISAKRMIKQIQEMDELTYGGGKNDSLSILIRLITEYGNLTADQASIVQSVNYSTLSERINFYNKIDHVGDLIKNIPTPSTEDSYYQAVEAAKTAYYALSDEERALLNASPDFDYEGTLLNHLAASEVIQQIQDLGNITYDGGVNDTSTKIADVEDLYNSLTDEQKEMVLNVNHDVLDHAQEQYDEIEQAIQIIKSIGDITFGGDNDSKAAIEQARKVYDSLTDAQKAVVDSYQNTTQVLEDGEQIYTVLELIDEIGEVNYDDDSLEKINAAKKFYNSLTDEQKAKVSNEVLETLTSAEKEYQQKGKEDTATLIVLSAVTSVVVLGGGALLFFKKPF